MNRLETILPIDTGAGVGPLETPVQPPRNHDLPRGDVSHGGDHRRVLENSQGANADEGEVQTREMEALRRRNLELEEFIKMKLDRGQSSSSEMHSAYLTPGEIINPSQRKSNARREGDGHGRDKNFDDLAEIFKNESQKNADNESFATPSTPRGLPDLIDLSTPPRATSGKDHDDLPSKSPGYKTAVNELKGEIAALTELFTTHFNPTIAPPPGLPGNAPENSEDNRLRHLPVPEMNADGVDGEVIRGQKMLLASIR